MSFLVCLDGPAATLGAIVWSVRRYRLNLNSLAYDGINDAASVRDKIISLADVLVDKFRSKESDQVRSLEVLKLEWCDREGLARMRTR